MSTTTLLDPVHDATLHIEHLRDAGIGELAVVTGPFPPFIKVKFDNPSQRTPDTYADIELLSTWVADNNGELPLDPDRFEAAPGGSFFTWYRL